MADLPNQADFDAMYTGTPPWDIGRPQGSLRASADAGGLTGRVLDAGGGTGEHALGAAARPGGRSGAWRRSGWRSTSAPNRSWPGWRRSSVTEGPDGARHFVKLFADAHRRNSPARWAPTTPVGMEIIALPALRMTTA